MKALSGNSPRTCWRRGATLLLLVLAASCATIPENYKAEPSSAFNRPQETTLGRAYATAQAQHASASGFRLLNNGISALMTRAAMADLAERAIDVQYYIFDNDDVGRFLLERLLAAAERGVRVRILLDDSELDFEDEFLARLDAHPNIEIRVFNAFPVRARWARTLQLVIHLDRLGRRMHNKVFAVDGQVAVLGGRNIGNRYFEARSESNFRDVDVFATGPVVGEVSGQFDAFWNSAIVTPVAAFAKAPLQSTAQLSAALRQNGDTGVGPHAEYLESLPEFARRLIYGSADLIWAQSRAIAEPPVRQASSQAKPSSEIARAHAIERQRAQKEMVMETAYFVPGDRGVELLSALAQRGVRVRILTNSLVSTDVPAVHAGYSRYREALVGAGIELHEYRSDAPRPERREQFMHIGRSESALHAKAVVYDRRMVWIGSANFDPRSRRLNTEDGLMIDSSVLAERVLATMEQDFSAENSWRLALEPAPDSGQTRLVWTGVSDGKPVRLTNEPGASILRQLKVMFMSILPGMEELL
jgi:putative cardiolipin synthase